MKIYARTLRKIPDSDTIIYYDWRLVAIKDNEKEALEYIESFKSKYPIEYDDCWSSYELKCEKDRC